MNVVDRSRLMPLTSMRSRLIAVVTVILAVAFTVTTTVNYELARRALKQAAIERELPLTGDTIYSKIQADLVRPIYISSQMAHDTFLRDWTLNGEKDPDKVRRFLDEIRKKYGFFTAFFVSDRTRRYYHFSGISKVVHQEDPRDAWYFRSRSMAGDHEINVDPNQQQGDKITIFINYKVYDYHGNVIGVTGVGLALDTVAGIIDQYRNDFNRNVFFADRSGRITLYSDPAVAYHQRLDKIPGMAKIAAKVLASNRGAFEYQSHKGKVLLTTRYIPELDWVLVVEERESHATAAALNSLLNSLLVGLVAIVLTGLAIGWVINRFQKRLEKRATVDSLTGLYNRQVFDISLAQAIERAHRNAAELALVLIDFDGFKTVNDRHGHLNGDRLLRRAAELLRDSVRRSDVVARWGGEEFAILMENCGAIEAYRAAELLRRRIAGDLAVDGLPGLTVTASFGVAAYCQGDSQTDLFGRADKALYQAKSQGRNRVCRHADGTAGSPFEAKAPAE